MARKKKDESLLKFWNSQNIRFRWLEKEQSLIDTKVMGVQIESYKTLISNDKNTACIISIYPDIRSKDKLEKNLLKKEDLFSKTAHYF